MLDVDRQLALVRPIHETTRDYSTEVSPSQRLILLCFILDHPFAMKGSSWRTELRHPESISVIN